MNPQPLVLETSALPIELHPFAQGLRARLKISQLFVAQVQPGSQATKLGVKAGDVLVSYGSEKIANRLDMQRAIAKALAAKLASIPVVIRRGEKTIELEFKPGPLGFLLVVGFDDPTFK